ncbi:hypothetical protein EB796_020230 [Bugula neritina]|uniref:Uncharacterized protein n=1 Tax=Bugula neritina TaxID=10212 RepID=A0A7J7J725_BUGNE|nr:hypothetical protein EB796_020230 [Bugula neritina]
MTCYSDSHIKELLSLVIVFMNVGLLKTIIFIFNSHPFKDLVAVYRMAELDRLLRDAKSTVEGRCLCPLPCWSIYGGLKRLSLCLENILNHGLKYSHLPNQSSTLDYSRFIKSLQWLNPVLAPSAEKIRKYPLRKTFLKVKPG